METQRATGGTQDQMRSFLLLYIYDFAFGVLYYLGVLVMLSVADNYKTRSDTHRSHRAIGTQI